MRLIFTATLFSLSLAFIPFEVAAHGGRTNGDGCHNQRSNGTYHCHGGVPERAVSAATGFINCTQARASGYANIRRGTVGYARHLDRDNDGVACET